MANGAYNEIESLQAQASALIQELRRAVRLMIAARESGDKAAELAWKQHILNVGQAYNAVVVRLHELEGPAASMKFLAQVGDVVISGVKAGATFTISAVESTAGVVGRAAAAVALPLFVPVALAVLALVWIAGKSGAFSARVSV